ncbi:hypothetical protein B0T26DRAFT_736377 [Lasiosphaeria miniovina]|uniref:Uncharacterized protein n=1 Tax=Lasiosphaeria miniovina TaxID=1954250 RepID=A0AA40BFS6_9PEZI|nr:uncharacterized protein B0T26DRAFT_736377 [Lasiosphaeria miniovina]KAK0733442.1 hypothetical protein B0T26DRAFT_736377 [Lasiosphaeria miniovina]
MASRTRTDDYGAPLPPKVLVEYKDSDDILADVVAIHGFGAHPTDAWTFEGEGKNTNWLTDETMLPAACPKVRILNFSYDSMQMGDNPARGSIPNLAMKLLSGLVEKRRECQTRPIIFAYMIAMMHTSDYPFIYDSITGFLSLGTPYKGFSSAKSLKQMYAEIVLAQMRTESNLGSSLAEDNDMLVGIVYDFARKINTRTSPPVVFCFFEERLTKFGAIAGVETDLEFVVNESSGTLNGHPKAGLSLGHFEMNKFEDSEDCHYQSVSYEIKNMVPYQ